MCPLHSRCSSETCELLRELGVRRVNDCLVLVVCACLLCGFVAIEGAADRVDQPVGLDLVVYAQVFQPSGELCAVGVLCEEIIDVFVVESLGQAIDVVDAWRS